VSVAGQRTCRPTLETPTWSGPRHWPAAGWPAHPGPTGPLGEHDASGRDRTARVSAAASRFVSATRRFRSDGWPPHRTRPGGGERAEASWLRERESTQSRLVLSGSAVGLATGQTRTPEGVRAIESSPVRRTPPAAVHSAVSAGQTGPGNKARLRRSQLITKEARHDEYDGADHSAGHRPFRRRGRACAPGGGRAAGPQGVPGTEPATATVTADEGQSRHAVTTAAHDGAAREVARPSASPGRPACAVEQAQLIFHELHADGRNTLCAVCDSQYESA
jgi:hypothetical protein